MSILSVKSSQGVYSVEFCSSISQLVFSLVGQPGVLVVIDRAVACLHREALSSVLEACPVFEVDATEDEKTLDGCSRVLSFLQAQGASRQTEIVAIGGGVLQDIVTFCAHVYFRGLKWTFVPTTLLAMADSCIGAKASINFQGYKNQLGVFHSPSRVRICVDFVSTLPEEEVLSGYGEIYKLHMIGSPAQFDALDAAVSAKGLRSDALLGAIMESLRIKKAYIEEDEFDNGVRRILNFGHTFGHAMEACTDHGIPHGIAVAWGMDLIRFIAESDGLLASDQAARIREVLNRRFARKTHLSLSPKALLEKASKDKKSVGGSLTLVIPTAVGQFKLVRRENDARLMDQIESYLATQSIIQFS